MAGIAMVAPAQSEYNLMKVVLITRSTLYRVKGGDTIQVTETARMLEELGIHAHIRLANEKIDYREYDLLHFFNITRPADMLVHIRRSRKPCVVTPIWIDYSAYDKQQRKGISGAVLGLLGMGGAEYAKTIGRFLAGRDSLASIDYAWKGQSRSIREVLRSARCLLVNSQQEYVNIRDRYGAVPSYAVVPNGVNGEAYTQMLKTEKQNDLVLCAARIEGIKNQYNLIKALNNTRFRLVLAGAPAPGQQRYYEQCRKIADENILFTGHLSSSELMTYYAQSKVHVLPSWFELCGLSSLEAAAMGCAVVVSPNGYARDYFKEDAFYCDPANPLSIRHCVEQAAAQPLNTLLAERIKNNYTWRQAAEKIAAVYKNILPV